MAKPVTNRGDVEATLTEALKKLISEGYSVAEGRDGQCALAGLLDGLLDAVNRGLDEDCPVYLQNLNENTVCIFDARDNLPLYFVRKLCA